MSRIGRPHPVHEFKNQRAVVTGGARGIGEAIARQLLDQGAEVHVFDLADGTGNSAGIHHRVDISDPRSIDQAVATLPGPATLLVNNAGITRDRSLAKMNNDEWNEVIDTNLNGAFYMIRALTPGMRQSGYGRIVNITSINGLRGKFGQGNYSAAKAGLIGLSKTAARELGTKGITVNCVAPGMVMTEMAGQLPGQIIQNALDESVLKKLAEPIDIANAVMFLLSDAARMITGEILRVDGGQYI